MIRGRPAYSGVFFLISANGVLRNKNKMYEFCGGPTEAPPSSKKQKKKGNGDIKSEDENDKNTGHGIRVPRWTGRPRRDFVPGGEMSASTA